MADDRAHPALLVAGAHITNMTAGHLSMISDPETVARVIEQAARATSWPQAHPVLRNLLGSAGHGDTVTNRAHDRGNGGFDRELF